MTTKELFPLLVDVDGGNRFHGLVSLWVAAQQRHYAAGMMALDR